MLKEENVVLDFRESDHEKQHIVTGQYSHILEHEGKHILYYQVKGNPESICYAISEDGGLTFTKPENNYVLKNSLACHNFKVFKDDNPNSKTKFKAIGGSHTGKGGLGHQGCDCQTIDEKECYDPVWPNIERKVFHDDVNHKCHGNGYYIWESDDGINWRTMYDKPVLSTLSSVVHYRKEGYLATDGGPSIFYDSDMDEYKCYLRGNLKLGVRHVFFTKSKDLLNWSKPELIKLKPYFNFDHDNLYYGGIHKHPGEKNKYIGFPSYFKNIIHDEKGDRRTYHDECTLVMVSDNGLKWKVKDKWFEGVTTNPEWSGHMRAPHILGFIASPDKKEFWLYIQKDFLTDHNTLVRYSISKEEFDKIINKE